MLIVYLHGFLSGANAVKATALRNFIQTQLNSHISFVSLDFPDTPYEAYLSLNEQIAKLQQDNVHNKLALVGSSMGGFFAALLSAQFKLKAALLNPCIHPQDYFDSLIGPQFNEYTQCHFELTQEMLDYLKKLDDELAFIKQENLLKVYLGAKDEVLDYQKSLAFFKDAQVKIFLEEDHAFTKDFQSIMPDIINFLQN